MVVFEDRKNEVACLTARGGVVAIRAFHAAPTEVVARFDYVDFLDRILPDIGEKKAMAPASVKREPPRIPDSVGVNLIQEPGHAIIGVAGGSDESVVGVQP